MSVILPARQRFLLIFLLFLVEMDSLGFSLIEDRLYSLFLVSPLLRSELRRFVIRSVAMCGLSFKGALLGFI